MKVFVTGAAGFIGAALVRRLLAEGHEVVALVRNPDHRLPAQVQKVRGDILSPETWKDSGRNCQRLYHLAAMISFDPAKERQLISVNGTGTRNVMEASSRWNLESTVVTSSACTFGVSRGSNVLLNEASVADKRTQKSNTYLRSKLAAEEAALSYSSQRRIVVVNPTTIYGPGDWTLNSGTLIKKIATSRLVPVPSGGSNVMDVEDAAEGIIRAGEQGVSGSRYILGGQNLSFGSIFSTIAGVLAMKPLLVALPPAARYPASLAAGITGKLTGNRLLTAQIVDDMFSYKYYSTLLATQQLGFTARRNFCESIERAVAFYRENGLLE